jgi:hypothetical protein
MSQNGGGVTVSPAKARRKGLLADDAVTGRILCFASALLYSVFFFEKS